MPDHSTSRHERHHERHHEPRPESAKKTTWPVRSVASVIVTAPVDGRSHRRSPVSRGHRTSTPVVTTVAPAIMDAVRRIRRENERVVIVSDTEVWLRPA